MLAAGAYSFRQQSRLAISLSWIGGYVNVVALLATTHTVSHTTGNTTSFVERLVKGQWHEVMVLGVILLCFLIGAVFSAVLTEGSRRRGARSKYMLPILVEAILLFILAVFFGLQYHGAWWHWSMMLSMVCLGSIVMGLQNATITHISGSVVRTTHVTGVFTDLGIEVVHLFFWWKDRLDGRDPDRTARLRRIIVRNPAFLRVTLLASIIGSFGFGVLAGTAIYLHLRFWTMFPPVLFLLWILYMDWRQPIADVRLLDPLNDQDLQADDTVRELLPEEVGLYRLFIHSDRHHRAPDFQKWVYDLPGQQSIVILMFSPLSRLDTNAAMDLRLAIKFLHRERKLLILAGLTPSQMHTLMQAGIVSLLSRDNLCDSLSDAISRAAHLLRAG